MPHSLTSLRKNNLFVVFNRRDERARGRCCMLFSAILSNVIADITAGTLYTAFLTVNNFSIADVGVISYLPFLGACFSLFSPLILERFKRRRWLLAGGRMAYYTINILGLTLLPLFVHDPTAKLIGFGAIVFTASLINNLFASGYTVWHLNFIPNEVRAKYFSYQQIISNLCSYAIILVSSASADALRGTPSEGTVLTLLRFVGFAMAIAEVIILLLPREYEYPRTARIRIANIFQLPFKNRKFMLTMSIIGFWVFLNHLTTSSWNYYLLNTAQVSITMINVFNFLYSLSLLVFMPFWRRTLSRYSWFHAFVIAIFFRIPTVFASAFLTAGNQIWLFPTFRLVQNFANVGLNLAYSNFQYINTPESDQTYYISFHALLVNLTTFIGQATGTAFIQAVGTQTVPLFGMQMGAPQLLMLIQCGLFVVCAILILCLQPVLQHRVKIEA